MQVVSFPYTCGQLDRKCSTRIATGSPWRRFFAIQAHGHGYSSHQSGWGAELQFMEREAPLWVYRVR